VVLVHGAGDCSASWTFVQRQIATFARVLRYDRAGVGASEQGPEVTLDRCLNELYAVVDTSGCVLVGHSFGAIIVRAFTQRYPDKVGALLQVDATPEAALGDVGVKIGMLLSSAAARLCQVAEYAGITRRLLGAGKLPWYPEQPQFRLVVSDEEYEAWLDDVARTFKTGAAAEELAAVLSVLGDAGRSMAGAAQFGYLPVRVLASNSHNVHLRNPNTVVEAVRNLARAAVARPG